MRLPTLMGTKAPQILPDVIVFMMAGDAWYIVGCVPETEDEVAAAVKAILELYDEPAHVECPGVEERGLQLSPGYIFLRAPMNPTVVHLVEQLDCVLTMNWGHMVTERSVKAVRKVGMLNEEVEVDDFPNGTVVNVIDGPFTGQPGVVRSRKGNTYLVEMEVFSRATSVRVHGKDIEASNA